MPLNTRSKKRQVVNIIVEFSIDNSAEQAVKLNLPKESIKIGAGESVKSTLVDISISGCGIDSPYIIPPGVILNTKIDPKFFNIEGKQERKETLTLVGVVKSCVMKAAGRYRLGAHFQSPKKEDIDFINNFITAQERRKDQRWPLDK